MKSFQNTKIQLYQFQRGYTREHWAGEFEYKVSCYGLDPLEAIKETIFIGGTYWIRNKRTFILIHKYGGQSLVKYQLS